MQSISIIAVIFLVTYKFRYNDYIMNLSSIYFVLAIVCFNTFFTIKSKMLQFVGKHAFSIYILQRIPMIFFEHYGFMKEYRYIFVIVVGLCTILIAVLFDNLIKKINSSLFANKNIQKMWYCKKNLRYDKIESILVCIEFSICVCYDVFM